MSAISKAVSVASNAKRVRQVAVIRVRAYERKPELGGGFRSYAHVEGESEPRFRSEIMASQFDAFRAAYDAAMAIAGDRSVGVGHYRGDRFRKNYFVYEHCAD